MFAAVLALAVGTASAAAKAKSPPPCWKVLIQDWWDGRIDNTYPIHCYRDALKHLPTDVDTYSSARDDIKQALQKRITSGNNGGASTTPGGSNGSGSGPGTGGGGGSNGDNGSGSQNASGPIDNLFNKTKPGNADSVPVPLIVLGAVALLLMAAGGAGFVARRMRTRKLQLASAASLPPQAGGSPPDQR